MTPCRDMLEVARLVEELMAAEDGYGLLIRPGVQLWRSPLVGPYLPTVYHPAICVVVQGSKRTVLGRMEYIYDPACYLISTTTVPARSELLEASAEAPFMSVVVDVDFALVAELLAEIRELPQESDRPAAGVMASAPVDPPFARTILRLLGAAQAKQDWRILGRGLVRELHYLALTGPNGSLLRAMIGAEGTLSPVARAVAFIKANLTESLDVSVISQEVGLSTSALHAQFKRSIGLSPMQYVKRLRLHQAYRRLLEGQNVTQSAYSVGYSSVSQFSREFRRYFGVAPSRAAGALLAYEPAGTG